MTHTPSPWEISAGDIWPVNGNPRVKIATITKPAPMNGINWQANANVIVAAPDMLEALRNLENDDNRMPPSAWAMVQAAIAKAEGR